MQNCNFDVLVQLLGNKLDPEKKSKVLDHLDRCAICRDTILEIARDLNKESFLPPRLKTMKDRIA